MVVKPKVVMAETPEQKDSMWTLHTDEDVAEVDAKAKAWTLKHNPRPEWVSTNPDMQADSAQKTVVNVPEATAGTGWGQAEQDWRAGLKNPNQHLENYWDDSSLPYQEHPETLWGTSAKYEGEGVKTTSWEEIDRGLTLDQLDPNYKYWQESQIYGSEHDGYIQSRNDRIAIALWNAWIRDPEGIRTWLEKQPWFMNSSEHDRNNTVMSIYKRMWVEPAKEGEAEWSPAKWEGMNLEDTEWGKIYGKDTPSETDPDRGIKTEVDPLNITNQMNATREANVKAMLSMKPEDIATSILAGTTPYGEQTLRDIQQYYPSFYALIQDSLKVKKWQQDINAITTSGTLDTEKQTEVSTERLQNDKEEWSKSVWGDKSEQLLDQANSDMASNKVASSAEEEMNNCQKDIAELQTRLKNLPQEARKAFKWDVPQYLVSAYVANKSQEIQDKIGELQSRYNAAMNLYQTEWEKYKWGKEYDLKKQQLEMEQDEITYNNWIKKQQLDREVVKDADWNILKYNEETGQWEKQHAWTKKFTNADLWRTWDSKTQKYNMTIWEAVNSIWHILESDDWLAVGTYSPWNWYTYNVYATRQDWMNATIWLLERAYYWLTLEEAAQKWVGKWKNISTAKKVIQDLWMSLWDKLSSDNVMKFIEAIGRWEGTIKNWQTLKDWLNWWKTYSAPSSTEWANVDDATKRYLEAFYKMNPNDIKQYQIKEIEKLVWDYQTFIKMRDDYLNEKYWNQTELERSESENDAQKQLYNVISNDWVTPIAFRQRIYNLIPATLKNSDAELKNLYETAKDLYLSWMSADDASLVFYWLNLWNDNTEGKIWRSLVNLARRTWSISWDSFWGDLGWFLERWDTEWAIKKVEDAVMSESDITAEKDLIWLIDNLVNLYWEINSFEKSYGKWWYASWKLNDLLRTYFQWEITIWDKKYYWDEAVRKAAESLWFDVNLLDEKWLAAFTSLAANISATYSEVRKYLMWVDGWTDWTTPYDDMFPSKFDYTTNMKKKIEALLWAKLRSFNWVRRYLWLPELSNVDQFLDYDKRAGLYVEKYWTFTSDKDPDAANVVTEEEKEMKEAYSLMKWWAWTWAYTPWTWSKIFTS